MIRRTVGGGGGSLLTEMQETLCQHISLTVEPAKEIVLFKRFKVDISFYSGDFPGECKFYVYDEFLIA